MLCIICGLDKADKDFRATDKKRCKKCLYETQKAWEKSHWERRQEVRRKSREKHREQIREYFARYYKNHPNVLVTNREYRKKYPDKYKAHQIANQAIRKRILIRSPICELCFKKSKTRAHHSDYNQPLQVIWLCQSCHLKTHRYKETKSSS